ncbi:hypothetical protein MED222_05760 [Vibrio sp. MED222]|nr:hypothetical protein MED222_05760 [Vibrio sp. MED222]
MKGRRDLFILYFTERRTRQACSLACFF